MAVNVLDMGKPQKESKSDREKKILPVAPDVGIFCSKCREFIQITKIRDHRAAHKALSIFGFRKMAQVKSLDQLAKKRIELQQSVAHEHRGQAGTDLPPVLRAPGRPKPPNCLDSLVMAKREYLLIDEAYQIIRDYCFFDKSPFILKPKADVRHCVGLPSLTNGITAIGVASEQNESFRPTMEDFRLLSDPYGPQALGACLFGVFDGYNGTRAANFASKAVPHVLMKELARIEPLFNEELNPLIENEDSYNKEITEKAQVLRLARDLTANILSLALTKPRPAHSAPMRNAHGLGDMVVESVTVEDFEPKDKPDIPKNDNNKKEDVSEVRVDDLKSLRWRRALAKCLVKVDENLASVGDEVSLVRWSGCSATIGVVVQAKHVENDPEDSAENDDIMIFLSNCGNCHAVIIENGRPRMLTEDHTVENSNEVRKVVERGGKLTGAGTKKLVSGLLATTRGLGNYGQPDLRKSVACSPFTSFRRVSSQAQMLVLGTPGLWSVLSKSEVTTIASQTVTYCFSKEQEIQQENSSSEYSRVQQATDDGTRVTVEDTMITPSKLAVNKGDGKQNESPAIHSITPKRDIREDTIVEEQSTTEEDQTDGSGSPHRESEPPPPWWKRNLTEDLPSATAVPLHGSRLESNMGEKTDLSEKIVEREIETRETASSSINLDRFYSQRDVEVAKTVALNLASAALLAGSQENITVQVLLLPNYQTLAEIHNDPLVAPLPNVPTALQF